MSNLDNILKFTEILQQFRTIERSLLNNKSDRNENDVEHSYSLAMLGWYINDTYKLNLNIDKIFKYALAHDLVEIHAGDTYFYQTTDKALKDKHSREEAAAKKLTEDFSEFPELHLIIEQYEKREDDESKFIYALDKIDPVLSIYLDGGRTWKKNKVTLEMLISMKKPKVAVNSTISAIFDGLIKRLTDESDSLFESDIIKPMEKTEQKKLYRSKTNKVFAGVCGGFAEYMNIDVVMIRLIWTLIVIFTGFFPGVLAYILAIFIIPQQK